MYNTVGITKGLSLTKIIGGLSKTLQIANQVIPLYQKTKPIINNAKSLFSIVKEFKKPSKPIAPQLKEKTNLLIQNNSETPTIKKESNTSPTFFL